MQIWRDHALHAYGVARRLEAGFLWSMFSVLTLRVTGPFEGLLSAALDPGWVRLIMKALLWTVFLPPTLADLFVRYAYFQDLATTVPATAGWFADWLLASVLFGPLVILLLPSLLRTPRRWLHTWMQT